MLSIKQINQLTKKLVKIKINKVIEKKKTLTKMEIIIKTKQAIHFKIKNHKRKKKMNGIKQKKNKEKEILELLKMMIARKINKSLKITEIEEEEVFTEVGKEVEQTEEEEVEIKMNKTKEMLMVFQEVKSSKNNDNLKKLTF